MSNVAEPTPATTNRSRWICNEALRGRGMTSFPSLTTLTSLSRHLHVRALASMHSSFLAPSFRFTFESRSINSRLQHWVVLRIRAPERELQLQLTDSDRSRDGQKYSSMSMIPSALIRLANASQCAAITRYQPYAVLSRKCVQM